MVRDVRATRWWVARAAKPNVTGSARQQPSGHATLQSVAVRTLPPSASSCLPRVKTAIAIGKLEGMLNPTGRRRLAKSVVAKDDGLLWSIATPSLLPFNDVSGEFIDVGARYALSVAGWHPSTGGLPLVALAAAGALEIRAVGARRGPVVRRGRCEAQRQ
jgi:hypothetical protein